MNKLPSMPLYVDDYEAATAHLTLEEDGVYSRLLRICWRSPNCEAPDDKTWLMRKLRADEACWERACVPVIEEFFTRKNGKIFQKRQKEEFFYVSSMVAAKKAAGAKGGKSKALKAKGMASSTASDLPEAESKQRNGVALAPTPTPTPTIRKEEEDAHAREASQDFEDHPADAAPPPPPSVAPGVLADIRQAVGIQPHAAGAYWSDATLTVHVEAWRSHGLTDDQIIAEATASRAKNPDPPDGPKALDRWMQAAANAKRNAPAHGQPKPAKAETKPASPEDRMKFFAEWVNGDRYVPPSAITIQMAHSLLDAGLVTLERLKAKGVTV